MTQLTLDFPASPRLIRCTGCSGVKPADDFYWSGAYHRQPCKECTKADRRRWRAENADLLRERQIGYMLKFNYGISREDYEVLLASQGGGCAICGAEPDSQRLAVDHCHDTDTVRGILCFGCNTGLGLLGHDLSLIERAAAYLEATA